MEKNGERKGVTETRVYLTHYLYSFCRIHIEENDSKWRILKQKQLMTKIIMVPCAHVIFSQGLIFIPIVTMGNASFIQCTCIFNEEGD